MKLFKNTEQPPIPERDELERIQIEIEQPIEAERKLAKTRLEAARNLWVQKKVLERERKLHLGPASAEHIRKRKADELELQRAYFETLSKARAEYIRWTRALISALKARASVLQTITDEMRSEIQAAEEILERGADHGGQLSARASMMETYAESAEREAARFEREVAEWNGTDLLDWWTPPLQHYIQHSAELSQPAVDPREEWRFNTPLHPGMEPSSVTKARQEFQRDERAYREQERAHLDKLQKREQRAHELGVTLADIEALEQSEQSEMEGAA